MANEAKNKTPKEVKKNSKDKRHFWKDFRAELKKVIWPTPKQLINNTVAVVSIVLVTAAIVFVLDLAFEFMNKYGIDQLKQMAGNTAIENVVDGNNTTDGNVVDNQNTVEDTNQVDNGENQNTAE